MFRFILFLSSASAAPGSINETDDAAHVRFLLPTGQSGYSLPVQA
jgi:hypothetical protein